MRTVLCVCTIFLAACVAGRPVHYYTLDPTARPSAAASPKPAAPVLLIGPIATPEILQDGRIRYRAGANEAGAYEYHRWVERPGSMLRNSLVRALRASGDFARVLDSSTSAAGDYLLRGKLEEFGEVDAAVVQTRISLHLELVDKKTGRTVWDRSIDRDEPVAAKTIPDVVQSLERNLQAVVSEMTSEIGKAIAK